MAFMLRHLAECHSWPRRTQKADLNMLKCTACGCIQMFWKNVLWSDVTQLELSGPMNQRNVWSKKGKANEQRTPSPWSNMEEDQSCYGGVLLLQEVEIMIVWRTSWIIWSIRPFWQESWCLWYKNRGWWSMDFLAGQSSQSIHPNLLMLGSGISCRMFLSGLLSLQI